MRKKALVKYCKALVEYCYDYYGNLIVNFRGNNVVYLINKEYSSKVLEDIRNNIEEYEKGRNRRINEASSLGVIINWTTVDGKNPFQLELIRKIENILEKNCKRKMQSLEAYM